MSGLRRRGKRLRKNSGIASWRSSSERDAGEPQRQRREREEVRQRLDLDERRTGAGGGQSRSGPRRADEECEVLAQVDAEPGALVALDVEPVDARRRRRRRRRVGPARRRPRTSTGSPAATSDSASRRTRGSSS